MRALSTIALQPSGVRMSREQRKLAAILAADVVGYSHLMGLDERNDVGMRRTAHLIPPAHHEERSQPALDPA